MPSRNQPSVFLNVPDKNPWGLSDCLASPPGNSGSVALDRGLGMCVLTSTQGILIAGDIWEVLRQTQDPQWPGDEGVVTVSYS